LAAADSAAREAGGEPRSAPEPGAHCANCGAPLQGHYCHVCGQNSDTHKRSLPHLIAESFESVFHLDGRLRRTLPDLFFHPGRLARDHMEGRIARHVPPFRTFLVALLLFMFAAEHATHEQTVASARAAAARDAALRTPQGRAAEAARLRAEAVHERDDDLKEYADDRAGDLKEADAHPARIEARYARELAKVQVRYAWDLENADHVARGLPPPPRLPVTGSLAWMTSGLRKAKDNPDYFLSVMFTWGHRVAFLLLPIVGLTLAMVYFNRRRTFIYDHLQVAMNFLSFVFLANAPGFLLPWPYAAYWFGAVALWTPVNLYQTLRGAYGSTLFGAAFKTLVVWSVVLFAFNALLLALLLFTLVQL
jgi:hypothetical protein